MRITLSDLARDLPAVSERARAEPVTITRDERDDLVLLSAEEYARLRERGRGRIVIVDTMDEETIALIEKTEMSPEYDYLDAELEGWDPDAPP